eukprot:2464579-Heterocapsa_arctica.AAC.1
MSSEIAPRPRSVTCMSDVSAALMLARLSGERPCATNSFTRSTSMSSIVPREAVGRAVPT